MRKNNTLLFVGLGAAALWLYSRQNVGAAATVPVSTPPARPPSFMDNILHQIGSVFQGTPAGSVIMDYQTLGFAPDVRAWTDWDLRNRTDVDSGSDAYWTSTGTWGIKGEYLTPEQAIRRSLLIQGLV